MAAEFPVVFLAFANDQDSHLATLKDESRAIFCALQPLEQDNAIAIHREESAEFDELYRDLLVYNDRIVIFHYAGHADGTMLQLEGGSGGASGIAGLLGQQSSLKLVFLNGCATKDQVKLLHDAGVPAVIATAVKISDSKATKLSTAFYSALAGGQSIFDAFESARNYIEGKFASDNKVVLTVNRHPNFDFGEEEEQQQSLEFEWTLYIRADSAADLEQWRLPQSREGWQIQLEDNQGEVRDLNGEPLQIDYRLRSRTIDVLNCQQCGIASLRADSDTKSCPLCGSKNTQEDETQTAIPDLHLPFSKAENDARTIVADALDVVSPEAIQLRKILVPYWLFYIETKTSMTAQRGLVKDMHADTLKLEWEEVKEQIDFNVETYLVPAFSGSQKNKTHTEGWQWDIDSAVTMQQLDLSTSFVALDVPVEAAFKTVSSYLHEEIAAEVSARIGGLQQKNIATDTRYKNIAVRSILLPHWCARVNQGEEESSILINGQTGALKFPQQPGTTALTDEGNLSMNSKNTLTNSHSEKTTMLVSIYSGVGIGVMVGLLMGLAAPQGVVDAKSVVSVFIGAVGVGLAALLGLNDRHFSVAKGLRIGSFGLAVAVSGLGGIYVRDNGLLSPSLAEQASELRAVFEGIDNKQIISLLSTGAKTTTDADGKTTTVSAQLKDLRSAMFSSGGVDRSVCSKLLMSDEDAADASGVLKNFRFRDPQGTFGWKNLADDVEKQLLIVNYEGDKELLEADQKALLFIARDAACGYIPNINPVEPGSQQCQSITSENVSADKLRSLFTNHPDLNQILSLVDKQISKEKRDVALKLLGPVLCSDTIKKEK